MTENRLRPRASDTDFGEFAHGDAHRQEVQDAIMLKWHIEYGGRRAPLERIELSSIRDRIDPVRDHLEKRLAALDHEEGSLDVVFVLDEDRKLSIVLRGSALLVNRARDILGDEDVIGEMLS